MGKLRIGPFRESVKIFRGSVQIYCTSYDNNKRPAELSRSRDPARLSTVEDTLRSRSHDNNRTASFRQAGGRLQGKQTTAVNLGQLGL